MAGAALLANAALARYPLRATPGALLRWTAFLQGAALLLAATCHPVLVLVAALLAGAGEGPQLTALFAVRHREAPARLRAQLFTTGASLKTTGYAAGSALAGQLSGVALPAALLAAAGLHLLAGAVPGERERVSRPGSGAGRVPDAPAGGGGGDDVLRHAVGGERVLGGDPLDPGAPLINPGACLVRGHVLELSRHRDIYPGRDRDRRR
ncbi:hypothetical protein ACFQVA_34260 [Actinomadura keratinilytica]